MPADTSLTQADREDYLRAYPALVLLHSKDVDRLEEGLRIIEQLRERPLGVVLAPRLDDDREQLQNERARLQEDLERCTLVGRWDDSLNDNTLLWIQPREILARLHRLMDPASQGAVMTAMLEYQPGFLKARAQELGAGLLPDSKDERVVDKPYAWYLATLQQVAEAYGAGSISTYSRWKRPLRS